ncbi:MAG: PIN domain-containing protein [Opitutus sp.]|nr:PIN domain-containing protein [Opitutus sp.]
MDGWSGCAARWNLHPMRLGVDSSVALAILKGESDGASWFDLLMALRASHALVVCDVAYAELSAVFSSEQSLQEKLSALGIGFDSVSPATAFLAGQMFAAYRKAGGPRQSLIPDFLIGAHALTQTGGLVTADRGYLRTYFRGLKILQPTNA